MLIYLLIICGTVLLLISTILIIITFAINNWLHLKHDAKNLGIWYFCNLKDTDCTSFYDGALNSTSFSYNSSFKAFQSLQAIFFGLCVIALLSVSIISILLYFKLNIGKLVPIFILSAICSLISTISGVISLIIFGTKIYAAESHDLLWCYWTSVAAVIVAFNSTTFLFALVFKIMNKKISKSSENKKLNPAIGENSIVSAASYLKAADKSINVSHVDLKYKKLEEPERSFSSPHLRKIPYAPQAMHQPVVKPQNYQNKSTPLPSLERKRLARIKQPNTNDCKNLSISKHNFKKNSIRYRSSRSEKQSANKRSKATKHKSPNYKDQTVYPGHSSQPNMITRSLDRVMPAETSYIPQDFQKINKLVFYNGVNFYARPDSDLNDIKSSQKFVNTKPVFGADSTVF